MNPAKDFITLACVALSQKNTHDAAQLLAEAVRTEGFIDFIAENAQGNVSAQVLADSLAQDNLFEVTASDFKKELDAAFSGIFDSYSGDDDDSDYDLGVGDDDDDEEDDDDFESDSSASPLGFID